MSIAGIVTSVAALFVSAIYIFALGAAVNEIDDLKVNTDSPNGVCDDSRFMQDPDC
jgi:hypothetical protein